MVKIILESATSAVNVTPYLIYGFLTILIVYVTSTVMKLLAKKAKAAHWAKIAKQKRAERDQQIQKLVVPTINISPQLEQKILNSDAIGLLEMLKSFETTSEEILITYFKRAITIGLDYQIITEINFEESLIKARECDKLRRDNPSACKGELFGLPITIKDSFVLKGTDASAGMACRVFKPAQEDGLVVRLLKGEGAIPFVKSNVPQAIMVTESNNHIWGQSDNPWQKGRGVGGSSGGEAAMIAGRLAPLGLGTDIAGSIRVPALHNGVVGFKPTAERLTLVGATPVCPTLRAFLNLKVAIGPIVKSVRDCNVLMKVLLNNPVFDKAKLTEQDAYYNRREWREDIATSQPKKLRIGYFKSLDLFPACITSQRAVEESVQALKKLGHDVVEVKFPDMDDIVLTLLEILSSEGNMQFLLDAVEGETTIEDYEKLRAGASVPNVLRKPLALIYNYLGHKRAAMMIERARKRTAYEFLRVVARHAETRKRFFQTWEENRLDALISPGYGHPAQKHGIFKHIFLGAAYTWIYNVLNVPAGVIPVTLVKEGEDKYPREICKWNDTIYEKMVETMEGSVGMPMGVHIVTLPWQDEKCVSIMHQLEKELQFVKKHPFPI